MTPKKRTGYDHTNTPIDTADSRLATHLAHGEDTVGHIGPATIVPIQTQPCLHDECLQPAVITWLVDHYHTHNVFMKPVLA